MRMEVPGQLLGILIISRPWKRNTTDVGSSSFALLSGWTFLRRALVNAQVKYRAATSTLLLVCFLALPLSLSFSFWIVSRCSIRASQRSKIQIRDRSFSLPVVSFGNRLLARCAERNNDGYAYTYV